METEDQVIDEESTELAVSPPANGAMVAVVNTPAQAKIDGVSKLLCKAIERASELTLTAEETKKLKAEFADECFRTGASGKDNLIYIEGMHLRNRLDEVLGIGQWSLVPRNRWKEEFRTNNGKPAIKVYVEAMLIVRGCYITEAIGDMDYYPHNAQTNYGDAVEGAESAALRRCAKKMGIGLQAWSKTWCEGWFRRQANGQSGQAERIEPEQIEQLNKLLELANGAVDYGLFKKWLNISDLGELTTKNFALAENFLLKKIPKEVFEWSGYLDSDPSIDDVNKRLPEIKALETAACNAVWKLVQARLMKVGYEFDAAKKKFRPKGVE